MSIGLPANQHQCECHLCQNLPSTFTPVGHILCFLLVLWVLVAGGLIQMLVHEVCMEIFSWRLSVYVAAAWYLLYMQISRVARPCKFKLPWVAVVMQTHHVEVTWRPKWKLAKRRIIRFAYFGAIRAARWKFPSFATIRVCGFTLHEITLRPTQIWYLQLNYTLWWRKVNHDAPCSVLTSHNLFQASSRDEAAGSSSQSLSGSRTAPGASSAASQSSGTVSGIISNLQELPVSLYTHVKKKRAAFKNDLQAFSISKLLQYLHCWPLLPFHRRRP